jgi:hypothetical protein
MLTLSSCLTYKAFTTHFFDGDELAYRMTRKSTANYKDALEATQAVRLETEHDYFRTGQYVRWKNDYNLSMYTLNFQYCAAPFDKVEFDQVGIGWKLDSSSKVEVNAKDLVGKEVPMKAYCKQQIVIDTIFVFPNRFVLDFGKEVGVGDSLFWNGSSNKNDRVLLLFEADSNATKELILKDQGFFELKKKTLKGFENANYLNVSIYRAKAQRFDVGDKWNRSLGVFYLEKATSSVDLKKEKP